MSEGDSFYRATSEDVKGWQDGGGEFLSPAFLISDLTEAQATAVAPGSPYSIAQVLSHMRYWQGRRFAKLPGQEWPGAAHLSGTFAAPEPGAWDTLISDFLRDLEAVKRLADEQASYGYVSRALHNGCHVGRIALLRQMLGFWPPAGAADEDV